MQKYHINKKIFIFCGNMPNLHNYHVKIISFLVSIQIQTTTNTEINMGKMRKLKIQVCIYTNKNTQKKNEVKVGIFISTGS